VLNVAQARRGGYFREQLRTFYEYQSEEGRGNLPQPALPDKRKSRQDKTEDESDNG
jgi:hypothetical protein